MAQFAPLLSETNQGRFYYDFNQNGIFEPTSRLQTGDPHFVGILEDPNQPHGPNNRAISRLELQQLREADADLAEAYKLNAKNARALAR